MDSASASTGLLKNQDGMLNQWEVNEEDLEFSWGHKRCLGGPNKSVQFYDSFTYNGIDYYLYDCVYMWCDDQPEPYIGKLVKIWETASHKRKVKVVWFFRPIEVKHWLGDIKPSTNEVFLASGEGRGLFNLNPLEAICGKCNVLCTSKDPRNPQPTEEDLRKADYIFDRSFDVQSCKISNNFSNEIAGVEVKHYFNLRNVQKSTLDTEYKDDAKGSIPSSDGKKNSRDWSSTGAVFKVPAGNLVRLANSPIKDGSSARYQKKYSEFFSSGHVDEIRTLKKKKLQVSSGPRPLSQVRECKESFTNSKDSFNETRNLGEAVASKEACQYGQSQSVQSHSQTTERRLNMDPSKWFKLQSWEDRMYEANEKGTLVLLENLDPSCTSTEVEEIVSCAFIQDVTAKMIKTTVFSSPNCGKALVIFKSKDAADSVISCLRKRCLMLGDRRPVVCGKIKLGDPGHPSRFFGHFNISKIRLLKNNADQRNAVSTSHFSQSNTIEFDMALEWYGLDERSKLWWKALYEAQAKEMEDLRNQIKDHQDQDNKRYLVVKFKRFLNFHATDWLSFKILALYTLLLTLLFVTNRTIRDIFLYF